MPGCCAYNCSNGDHKGYQMFAFPRDTTRRAVWAAYTRRINWKPTNSSYLCEKHFEQNQFELKRADGKKKLKWNATPTIFSFSNEHKPFRHKTKMVDKSALEILDKNASNKIGKSSRKSVHIVRKDFDEVETIVLDPRSTKSKIIQNEDDCIENIVPDGTANKIDQSDAQVKLTLAEFRITQYEKVVDHLQNRLKSSIAELTEIKKNYGRDVELLRRELDARNRKILQLERENAQMMNVGNIVKVENVEIMEERILGY